LIDGYITNRLPCKGFKPRIMLVPHKVIPVQTLMPIYRANFNAAEQLINEDFSVETRTARARRSRSVNFEVLPETRASTGPHGRDEGRRS